MKVFQEHWSRDLVSPTLAPYESGQNLLCRTVSPLAFPYEVWMCLEIAIFALLAICLEISIYVSVSGLWACRSGLEDSLLGSFRRTLEEEDDPKPVKLDLC